MNKIKNLHEKIENLLRECADHPAMSLEWIGRIEEVLSCAKKLRYLYQEKENKGEM